MTERGRVEVPPPKHRGRPKVEEPGSAVMTWLPVSYHDRLIELAKRHTDGNVSALVRSLLILRLK